MAEDLEGVIRRGQDRIRGRPKNWKDTLRERWSDFSLHDNIVRPITWWLFSIGAVLLLTYIAYEVGMEIAGAK